MNAQRQLPEIERLGGEIAAVGMGDVTETADFHRRYALTFPCLADPERIAFRAYRIPRGNLGQIAGPRVWGKGLFSTLRSGFGLPRGDVRQLQANFIVDSGGSIRLAHYGAHSADEPTWEEVRTRMREAKASS